MIGWRIRALIDSKTPFWVIWCNQKLRLFISVNTKASYIVKRSDFFPKIANLTLLRLTHFQPTQVKKINFSHFEEHIFIITIYLYYFRSFLRHDPDLDCPFVLHLIIGSLKIQIFVFWDQKFYLKFSSAIFDTLSKQKILPSKWKFFFIEQGR